MKELKRQTKQGWALGYTGKIQYWSGKLVEAAGDYKALWEAEKKLNYFVERQKEWLYNEKIN